MQAFSVCSDQYSKPSSINLGEWSHLLATRWEMTKIARENRVRLSSFDRELQKHRASSSCALLNREKRANKSFYRIVHFLLGRQATIERKGAIARIKVNLCATAIYHNIPYHLQFFIQKTKFLMRLNDLWLHSSLINFYEHILFRSSIARNTDR